MADEGLRDELVALRAELTALRAKVERPRRAKWLVAALVVVSSAAWAQLVTFTADTPALASQVNANFSQLQTWLEQKVGPVGNNSVTTGAVSATALNLNNNRITNVAQPSGDNDVVTKAHLKALFNGMVIWVAGPNCPTGFSRYATGEGRYALGDFSGNQGLGGVTSIYVATQQQQSGGSGYAKTGAVYIGTNLGGVIQSGDATDVVGPWTYRQSGNLDIRPVYVLLKPCVFNSAY